MMWRRPILGVAVAMVSGCGFAQIACSAHTPQQALPSGWVAAAHESASSSSASFYRVAQIVIDPELHRRWALIANCTHPERPLEIVALSTGHTVHPTLTAESVPSAPPTPGVTEGRVQTEVVRRPAISSPPRAPVPTAVIVAKTSTPDPSTMLPVIRAGDLVRLWSSDGNVRLEMAVVSLEYGRVGQIIHVRRMGQTALLAGVVVGKDSAELIP
ncbi:MAG: flagella basal body P-ring formation protein FlgA [Acidobacteriaceae bacterium]